MQIPKFTQQSLVISTFIIHDDTAEIQHLGAYRISLAVDYILYVVPHPYNYYIIPLEDNNRDDVYSVCS